MSIYTQYNNSSSISDSYLSYFKDNISPFDKCTAIQCGNNEYVLVVGTTDDYIHFTDSTVYRLYRTGTNTYYTLDKHTENSTTISYNNIMGVYSTSVNSDFRYMHSSRCDTVCLHLLCVISLVLIFNILFKGLLKWLDN